MNGHGGDDKKKLEAQQPPRYTTMNPTNQQYPANPEFKPHACSKRKANCPPSCNSHTKIQGAYNDNSRHTQNYSPSVDREKPHACSHYKNQCPKDCPSHENYGNMQFNQSYQNSAAYDSSYNQHSGNNPNQVHPAEYQNQAAYAGNSLSKPIGKYPGYDESR